MRILDIESNPYIKKYNDGIANRTNIIAKFHSPNCPACKAMENSWAELPKVIKQMGYNAKKYYIANINVDKLNNNKLHGWQDIRYVPTIANINGNNANIYNGEMDAVSIAQFIIKEYKLPKLKKHILYDGRKRTKNRTKNITKKNKSIKKNNKYTSQKK
jgi:hypothetical protein